MMLVKKFKEQKKGGVTSVAQGHEKALNPKERKINKIDDGKVGIDKKEDFWTKQNQDEEKSKAQPKLQRTDPNYTVDPNQRNKFWQENQEQRAVSTPQSNEYNKKKESDEYWSKVNADQQVNKPPVSGAPARPPGKIKPPQHVPEPEPVQEPAYEEPAQTYEEPVATEQPAYEEPVHEEPVHEEPVHEEPAQSQSYQQAKALYDYAGEAEGDLAFSTGDIITIHDTSDPGGWWQGELNGVVGVFPSNFVEIF